MSNTTTSKKATATKKTVTTVKAEVGKTSKFIGILYQYKAIEGSTNKICWFETLNASKTKTVKFAALLKDDTYLAGYIRNHTPLEVTVVEVEPDGDKRRWEIVSILSESERINFNKLLEYAEAHNA